MKKILTLIQKAGLRTFDEYWAQRDNPSAITAWEEALKECEKAFRQEREAMFEVIEVLSSEVLKLDPGNEIAKEIKSALDGDKDLPGESSPGR